MPEGKLSITETIFDLSLAVTEMVTVYEADWYLYIPGIGHLC